MEYEVKSILRLYFGIISVLFLILKLLRIVIAKLREIKHSDYICLS